MYEAYFGLAKRLFVPVPCVEQYFPATTIESARQSLVRCVERAEGVAMVVGPSGTGKTLLCQVLAEHFKKSFDVAVLSRGRLGTRRALFQAILFELGQPYRGLDEGELRLALVDYLTAGEDCPEGMVLLVDEAHTLPLRLLDELRMISNLACHGQPRVRLVLIGGPLLEERLASPKLESFSQRIVARQYLEAFDRAETQQFVYEQITKAGGRGEELFSPEACQAVHQATDGIPRLISQVCDHALVLAYAAGRRQVDRAGVEEAWADLQQLPTPWNGDRREDDEQLGVIEFGRLEEEDAEQQPGDSDPATVSMLRVAEESDESECDPVEQITEIQDTLAELDGDFQPAGSIGPEVELVFDGSTDPFGEKFEEEEVVDDRVAPPRQTSQQPSPNTADDLERDGNSQPSPPTPGLAAGESDRQAAESPETTWDDLPKQGAAQATCGDTAAQEDAAASDAEARTVLLRRGSLMESLEPDEPCKPEGDQDMILVEDDYDDGELPPGRPPARVRRQEYTRLFTMLRGDC